MQSRLLTARERRCYPKLMLVMALLIASCSGLQQPTAPEGDSISNPVADDSADPWVIRRDGRYYYTRTTGGDVRVWSSAALQNVAEGEGRVVWDPPEGTGYSQQLWAPELHYLRGKWYIYVAASDGDNANHRMYVLESKTQDPQGAYTFKGKIAASADRWAIDGTVLQHGGRLYFIWSGWEGTENVGQSLYIAPMENPWTVSGERTLLARPKYEWEMHGLPEGINEGPQVLRRGDRLFLTFSASGFWTPQYAIGMLEYVGGTVTDPAAWLKAPEPVFSGVGTAVQGTGHASFTTSCDDVEHWIVYHAHRPGDAPGRDLRMQPFAFDEEGRPVFGQPVPPGTPINAPSGCSEE